mgnify:CR=1 FL=1
MQLNDKKFRLAILASHPIEYQGPLFQKLAKEHDIDLHVYYCWKFGVENETFDTGFNRKIRWDIPLLEGYSYSFLANLSLFPSGGFFGEMNPGIISAVTKRKHDAFLVLGWSSFTSWLLYLTSFVRGVPVLIRGENPLSLEFKKPAWKRAVKKLILGFLFRRAAVLLPIGKENEKFYEYYGAPKKKLFFAPYAVDNDRFVADGEKYRDRCAALKKELGIDSGKPVILFVGKLIPRKRPMDLLRAYESVSDRATLVYVGDGTLQASLKAYAREKKLTNVHFLGFQNQAGLPRLYASADIFALPSGWETWGLVVNEAMCFSLPIIASNVLGCIPDLVYHGENGYVFNVGDISAFSGYLRILVNDPKKRLDFGRRSFEIIKNYSYERDIESMRNAVAYIKK